MYRPFSEVGVSGTTHASPTVRTSSSSLSRPTERLGGRGTPLLNRVLPRGSGSMTPFVVKGRGHEEVRVGPGSRVENKRGRQQT